MTCLKYGMQLIILAMGYMYISHSAVSLNGSLFPVINFVATAIATNNHSS